MRIKNFLIGVGIVGILIVSFYGCQQERATESTYLPLTNTAKTSDQSFSVAMHTTTVDLPAGPLTIHSVTVDSSIHSITFGVEAPVGGTPQPRNLILQLLRDGQRTYGFAATMFDSNGNLTWEMGLELLSTFGDKTKLWEKTPLDSLSLVQSIGSDWFEERYTINGVEKKFWFPTADVDHIAQQWNAILNPESPYAKYVPSNELDAEINRVLLEFSDFYDRHNSLSNNAEGEIIAQFLNSQPVYDWFDDSFGPVDPAHTDVPEEICHAALHCAELKCPEAGFANPACDICLGVVVVCIVERIGESLSWW